MERRLSLLADQDERSSWTRGSRARVLSYRRKHGRFGGPIVTERTPPGSAFMGQICAFLACRRGAARTPAPRSRRRCPRTAAALRDAGPMSRTYTFLKNAARGADGRSGM